MTKSVLNHGYSSYSHGLCRCPMCTDAARQYRRSQRARRLASERLEHGLRASYDCGCRCSACIGARQDAYRRVG